MSYSLLDIALADGWTVHPGFVVPDDGGVTYYGGETLAAVEWSSYAAEAHAEGRLSPVWDWKRIMSADGPTYSVGRDGALLLVPRVEGQLPALPEALRTVIEKRVSAGRDRLAAKLGL